MQSSKRMMKRLPRYRQNGMMQKKKKKKECLTRKILDLLYRPERKEGSKKNFQNICIE